MMNTISRWEPFRGVTSLQEEVNRLFESTVRGNGSEGRLTTWAPGSDIYEAEDSLVVTADLPGMKESNLDVRVENNRLTIRGERKFESEVKEENYLRVERSYGSFTRSFSLPNTIKSEGISATYENGVLTVKLPKREETKPRQVKVNVQSNGK
jgi:HSP20 family protein